MKENGILQEHTSLLQDLATLEASLAEGGSNPQAGEWLRALELRLGSHMTREEEGGWMQEVLEHAPHQARDVRRLQEEHSRLKTGFSAMPSIVSTNDRGGISMPFLDVSSCE